MRLVHTVVAFACLSITALSASSAFAQAKTFKIDDSGNNIQFESDAPLEKFTGKTTKASGEITVDPAKPAGAKGTIKVPVDSIKTGVELRDEHLRGDTWLDAKKNPNAEFTITKISGVDKLKANDAVDATVTGRFTIHGVTKEVTATAKVRYTPGTKDKLRIQASFVIKLEDHKIEVPAIVKLKVSPDINVKVDLVATAS
jgi:polyisoprenoid-binding protein YceI